MIEAFIKSVGLVAPGLFGWGNAKAVLDGSQMYRPDDLPALKPPMLQANERRRTSITIKLALQAIYDALGDRAVANDFASVFASSEGDLEIVNHICTALDQEERPVSPTHFHNSVHNAPAGYACIAAGSHAASTSLAALDGTFACGLLEASIEVVNSQREVLCVIYDNRAPFPLDEFMPIHQPFAAAMLLSPKHDGSLSGLKLSLLRGQGESRMADQTLERLRVGNPAARALPLLQQLASGGGADLCFPYLPGLELGVELHPC